MTKGAPGRPGTPNAETWVRSTSGQTAGTMLTTRRPRRVPNSTLPAESANRVSSLPRPTLEPGWKWVPRWRTMISPALTSWPPKRFTPRRWEFESRPFLVEAAPFLCAMSSVLLVAPSGGDVGDLDLGVLLAVTLALLVAGLVLELLDDDLGTLGGTEHLDGDAGLVEARGGDLLAVDDHDDGERQRLADTRRDLIDLDDVAHSNLLLLAASAHDCVHGGLTLLGVLNRGWLHNRLDPASTPRINVTEAPKTGPISACATPCA